MTNRMVGSVLILVMLLFNVEAAVAQTYTQMQWGMNKGVTPYQFGANINGTWRDFGTISSAGVLGVTLGSLTVNGTSRFNPTGGAVTISSVASHIGRISVCNNDPVFSGTTACGYFSAYANGAFPYSSQLTWDMGLTSAGLYPAMAWVGPAPSGSVYTQDSRFEIHVAPGSAIDNLVTCGSESANCQFGTQWLGYAGVGGPKPREMIIGLASNTGVIPLKQGLRMFPLMSGSTVAAVHNCMGDCGTDTGSNLAVVSTAAETSQNQQLRVDGSASTNGANIQLIGNGATTPKKTLRVGSGTFQILNDAYTTAILVLTDAGNLTISGALKSVDATIENTATGGANLRLNGDGGTTPNKTIRAASGQFQVINNAFSAAILSLTDSGDLTVGGTIKTKSYTVATLPTCNVGAEGSIAYVTDAITPTYNGALTGGGAVRVPVFCDGSAWTSH